MIISSNLSQKARTVTRLCWHLHRENLHMKIMYRQTCTYTSAVQTSLQDYRVIVITSRKLRNSQANNDVVETIQEKLCGKPHMESHPYKEASDHGELETFLQSSKSV